MWIEFWIWLLMSFWYILNATILYGHYSCLICSGFPRILKLLERIVPCFLDSEWLSMCACFEFCWHVVKGYWHVFLFHSWLYLEIAFFSAITLLEVVDWWVWNQACQWDTDHEKFFGCRRWMFPRYAIMIVIWTCLTIFPVKSLPMLIFLVFDFL